MTTPGTDGPSARWTEDNRDPFGVWDRVDRSRPSPSRRRGATVFGWAGPDTRRDNPLRQARDGMRTLCNVGGPLGWYRMSNPKGLRRYRSPTTDVSPGTPGVYV